MSSFLENRSKDFLAFAQKVRKFADTDCVIVEMEGVRVQPLDGLDRNLIPIYPDKGELEISRKGTEDKVRQSHSGFGQTRKAQR